MAERSEYFPYHKCKTYSYQHWHASLPLDVFPARSTLPSAREEDPLPSRALLPVRLEARMCSMGIFLANHWEAGKLSVKRNETTSHKPISVNNGTIPSPDLALVSKNSRLDSLA